MTHIYKVNHGDNITEEIEAEDIYKVIDKFEDINWIKSDSDNVYAERLKKEE